MKKMIYLILVIFVSSMTYATVVSKVSNVFGSEIKIMSTGSGVYTEEDYLSVLISGGEILNEDEEVVFPSISYSSMRRNVLTLVIDVDYLYSPDPQMLPYWEENEALGFLKVGDYRIDLFVYHHIYDNYNDTKVDDKSFDFSVIAIPEPTTILLLGIGSLFFIKKK